MKLNDAARLGRIILSGWTLVSVLSCSQKQDEPRKPNIIYIMADDMGYNDRGCYGSSRIQTPHIDCMALELTSLELYNLDTDVGEQNNLVEEMPEKVAEMMPLFEQDHLDTQWFPLLQ